MEFERKETTKKVWKTILKNMPDLEIFGSYIDLESSAGIGVEYISYGFKGAEFPLIECYTRWDIWEETENNGVKSQQEGKKYKEYWLCYLEKCNVFKEKQ